jgi:copper(I)-binding protein
VSPVRRRRVAAASLALATTLALGGCGTSFNAQTNQVYQPAVGANASGEVDVMGVLLVANSDGSATLSAALENNRDQAQQLTSVSATTREGAALEVRSPKSQVSLAPAQLTQLGKVTDSSVYLVPAGAEAGRFVEVTFTFSETEAVTIEAPVVARNSEYDSIAGSASAE